MNGWVFDIAAAQGGMTVWFRTATGETIALFAPFRPSFVLAGNRLKEPALRAAAARWKCDLARGEGIDFLSGRTIPAWSFTVPGPALLGPSVRKAEKAFGAGGAVQRRHRAGAAVLLRDRPVPPVARRGRLRRRRDDPLRPRPRFAVGRGRAASLLFDRAPPDGRDGPPGASARPPARVHRRRRDAKSPLGERGGLPSGPGAARRTGRPRPARHRVRRRLAAAAASRAGRPAPRRRFPWGGLPEPPTRSSARRGTGARGSGPPPRAAFEAAGNGRSFRTAG